VIDYDIITIGGGLGGAALAKSMSERGRRVLVLERETKFKDRVRGEGMVPWGAAEARELGIYDLIMSSCGHELPWWDNYAGPMQTGHREMPVTTPQGLPTLAFYHPHMQETLLDAAGAAGAEVRRGARAKAVTPGREPKVTIETGGGKTEEATARIVVGVDGRGSLARKWGGFTEQRDPERLRIGGLVLEDSAVPQDTVRLVSDSERGRASIVFPQGGSRARMYFICGTHEGLRLQGDKDVPQFIAEAISTGVPKEFFDGARPDGPLATFDGADNWVEHPYRDGIALVGDAAASTDPSWGQGLSLTLRDVRILRDALSATDDWDAAGKAYAAEHDRYFETLHTVHDWMAQLVYGRGPEADARRARAFPLIDQDPTRFPDDGMTGPDQPATEERRKRFFGED
jgi:2-polyprenyl-6-methoxyphenol hydroxylase-like FAD-dependent oxidoreductase